MVIDSRGYVYFKDKEEEKAVVAVATDIMTNFLNNSTIPISPEDIYSFNLGVLFEIYGKDIIFDDDTDFLEDTNSLYINKGMSSYRKWRKQLC